MLANMLDYHQHQVTGGQPRAGLFQVNKQRGSRLRLLRNPSAILSVSPHTLLIISVDANDVEILVSRESVLNRFGRLSRNVKGNQDQLVLLNAEIGTGSGLSWLTAATRSRVSTILTAGFYNGVVSASLRETNKKKT